MTLRNERPVSPLFASFVAEFTQRRPGLLALDEDQASASIVEGSPGFGSIEIHDDGNELTVVVGRFTHCHFQMYNEHGDERGQQSAAVADALKFIEDTLDGNVAFYGTQRRGGGCFGVGDPRGWLSRMLGPRYVRTWSGKVYDRDWTECS